MENSVWLNTAQGESMKRPVREYDGSAFFHRDTGPSIKSGQKS
jgi:hypothetical protein